MRERLVNRIRRGIEGMVECFGAVWTVLILLLCLVLCGVAWAMHGPAVGFIDLGVVTLAVAAFADIDDEVDEGAPAQPAVASPEQYARLPSAEDMTRRRLECAHIMACLGGNHAGHEL